MTGEGAAIRIRGAGPRDLAAVARIERASFGDPWSDEALLAELIPDPMRLPLVAEQDGRVCGFLMAWRVVDQLHVLNIAAAPDVRRGGVGTALLAEAARLAAASGLVEVTLEVRAGNAGARAFYRRHAFAEAGLRPRYYSDNGEDAVIMTAACAAILAGL
ncbi:MAG TPA: ribosomal protein S18-alanine N-acetyltransferase [Candidatus Krumholzibacteria bacterium]|nr:ribosomal protein S18-alanine N-acetyltransferase [Candidatus Krumholzibacteria bacterium]